MTYLDSNKHMLIPLDLIQYVLQHKLINPFKTLIYLKYNYGGYVHIDANGNRIIQDLNIKNLVTLKTHLKKLYMLDWIGFEGHYSKIYLRSFKYIGCSMEYYSSRNAIFELCHLADFRGFLAASFIHKLILSQKGKKYRENKKGGGNRSREKARVQQRNPTPSFSISTTAIAKMLKYSLSTAHKLKIDSVKNKLVLKHKKMVKIIELEPKLIKVYAKFSDLHPGNFKKKGNSVYKTDTDQFSIGNLGTKRSRHNIMKKNETYIKHYR